MRGFFGEAEHSLSPEEAAAAMPPGMTDFPPELTAAGPIFQAPYMPIPVHTVSGNPEYLLRGYDEEYCPVQKAYHEQAYPISEKEFADVLEPFYDHF